MSGGPLGPNYRKLFGSAVAANLGDGLMTIAVVWLASARHSSVRPRSSVPLPVVWLPPAVQSSILSRPSIT